MQMTDGQLEVQTKQTMHENEQMASELAFQHRETERLGCFCLCLCLRSRPRVSLPPPPALSITFCSHYFLPSAASPGDLYVFGVPDITLSSGAQEQAAVPREPGDPARIVYV